MVACISECLLVTDRTGGMPIDCAELCTQKERLVAGTEISGKEMATPPPGQQVGCISRRLKVA
ncbi:hypothetical protein OAF96_00275 [bacterium]|nr:hypothetical protein [bacterium]